MQEILSQVSQFIQSKETAKTFVPGQSWVQYSGPVFDSSEYTAAVEALLNGWLIFGPKCRQFEEEIAKALGRRYAVFVNSGSTANLLAFCAVKEYLLKKHGCRASLLEKFDGVFTFVPACSFPTTVNPILQSCFSEPVFLDSAFPDANPDLKFLEDELRIARECYGDTALLLFCYAPVLGNPVDMDRLEEILRQYNVTFIHDTCDALGSRWDGKLLSQYGLVSTLSLFPAHHITTGEGGVVATDDPGIYQTLLSLRDWGRACVCQGKGDVTGGTVCKNRFQKWFPDSDIVYDHRYVFERKGYNLKPLEVQGAIGLEQVKKIPEFEKKRKENFERLYNIFSKYTDTFVLPQKHDKADPSWFGFMLVRRDGVNFDVQKFIEFLESNKIQTRRAFSGNLLLHGAYKEYRSYADTCMDATKIMTRAFFLGVYPGLTEQMLDYIEEKVNAYFESLSSQPID